MKEGQMEKEKESPKELSRREFVKGAAAVAGVGALAGCAPTAPPAEPAEPCPTCPPAEECPPCPSATPWLPDTWDDAADVVVLGAGFAAQVSAIEAHDAGADVLMLEKAPEKFQGGNSRVCGQGFIAPSPAIWDDYEAYLEAATAGQGYPVPDGWIRFFIESSYKNREWFEGLGAEVVADVDLGRPLGSWIPFYPQFPGADAVASEPGYYTVGGDYAGPGSNWYFLEDQVLDRGIRKMFETPGTRLVQDPETKEILGVVAESGGKEIYVKAKRAVCVCNGGYEFNQEMCRDYIHIPYFLGAGSPYNTGDGIKMCMAVGADLRNMGTFAAPSGLYTKVPEYQSAVALYVPREGGVITVGGNNKRWRDEYRTAATGIQNKEKAVLEGATAGTGTIIENGAYVRDKFPLPIHMIFDEEARLSGARFIGAWSMNMEGYASSEDSVSEIEMGWLVKADTIEELATKIGRDPDALVATVNTWNQSCAAGEDLECGRANNLVPIENGPFYALEQLPGMLNTQGGMWRNTDAQVLDKERKPIPRLYAAGENGGLWTHLYQCMSNVGGDCYGWGRVAGQNAAAEEPWG
jgi:succinate dehydrogenase/fumarate reductase flavoprotein subunit